MKALVVCGCCYSSGNGRFGGVDEGGVEGAEGELGDYVGEVECWVFMSVPVGKDG